MALLVWRNYFFAAIQRKRRAGFHSAHADAGAAKIGGAMSRSMSDNVSGNWAPRLRLLIIPFCALLVVAPLLWHGNSCGNDFNFHLLSWMEAHAAWAFRNFYPHWAMQPNSGAGEPRFIFYPPISWMLGAALSSLLGGSARGWSATPGAFDFLVLTLAGFSMLALLRRITTAHAALFTACLYIANPYTLFVIYERSDFAELMAAIWMPLLFLFALQQCVRILPLALIVAALWLTHDASAVMGCYALALLVLTSATVEYRQQRNLQDSVQRIWRAAAGVALGIGLAAFYIVPAAYEQRWVQIEEAIAVDINPVANFLFRHTADALHDHVLFMVSWIAVSLLSLGAMLCLMLWRQGKLQKKFSSASLAGHCAASRNWLFAFAGQHASLAPCAGTDLSAISLATAGTADGGCFHSVRRCHRRRRRTLPFFMANCSHFRRRRCRSLLSILPPVL